MSKTIYKEHIKIDHYAKNKKQIQISHKIWSLCINKKRRSLNTRNQYTDWDKEVTKVDVNDKWCIPSYSNRSSQIRGYR
jgi:hypothetical protein